MSSEQVPHPRATATFFRFVRFVVVVEQLRAGVGLCGGAKSACDVLGPDDAAPVAQARSFDPRNSGPTPRPLTVALKSGADGQQVVGPSSTAPGRT